MELRPQVARATHFALRSQARTGAPIQKVEYEGLKVLRPKGAILPPKPYSEGLV